MKPMTINYVCFTLLIVLFTAVVSTIPQAIKAKQTISSGIQTSTSTSTYNDVDAIDHEARAYCNVHVCTLSTEEVSNPFKE